MRKGITEMIQHKNFEINEKSKSELIELLSIFINFCSLSSIHPYLEALLSISQFERIITVKQSKISYHKNNCHISNICSTHLKLNDNEPFYRRRHRTVSPVIYTIKQICYRITERISYVNI